MKYIIKNEFALRGWADAPYTIVHLNSGQIAPVSKLAFEALLLCDGKTEVDSLNIITISKNSIILIHGFDAKKSNLIKRDIVKNT